MKIVDIDGQGGRLGKLLVEGVKARLPQAEVWALGTTSIATAAMLKAGEKMVAYRFEGYWKDVGTLDSLWDANMDMLSPGSGLNLLDKRWPIYSRTPSCPPAFFAETADVGNSAVAKGCDIRGEVEEGAVGSYSVLMPGAVVKKDARVEYAILGENSLVGESAHVGAGPETAADPDKWGVAVLGPQTEVTPGETVPAGAMLDKTHGQEVKV